ASLSDRSFLNRWMPTVLSMCHGGIWRAPMRAAIDFTQGRASSYVTSDIGAIWFARWHDSHLTWKIGAMSLVKVGRADCAAARGAVGCRAAPADAGRLQARAAEVVLVGAGAGDRTRGRAGAVQRGQPVGQMCAGRGLLRRRTQTHRARKRAGYHVQEPHIG